MDIAGSPLFNTIIIYTLVICLAILTNPKNIISNNGLLLEVNDEEHKIPLYAINLVFILLLYGIFNAISR